MIYNIIISDFCEKQALVIFLLSVDRCKVCANSTPEFISIFALFIRAYNIKQWPYTDIVNLKIYTATFSFFLTLFFLFSFFYFFFFTFFNFFFYFKFAYCSQYFNRCY